MTSYDRPHIPTLLSLPSELKQEILRYVLCTSKPILFRDGEFECDFPPDQGQDRSHHLAILSTCRDLNEHGRLVLHRFNTFDMNNSKLFEWGNPKLWDDHKNAKPIEPHDIITANRWAVKIGAHNRALISKLHINVRPPILVPHKLWNLPYFSVGERRWLADNAEIVHNFVQFLDLFRMHTPSFIGLRHLEVDYSAEKEDDGRGWENDPDPVNEATTWRALSMLTQLQSLKVKGIPFIWIRYLNRLLRIPISSPKPTEWAWDIEQYITDLEHEMRMCKTHASYPATKIPSDWKESAEYRAIQVPEPPERGVYMTDLRDEDVIHFYTSGRLGFAGTIHEPECFPPDDFEPDRTLSSILQGVEATIADKDLLSSKLSAVKFHEREYELKRRKHAYLMAIWNEFKILGLFQQKDVGRARLMAAPDPWGQLE